MFGAQRWGYLAVCTAGDVCPADGAGSPPPPPGGAQTLVPTDTPPYGPNSTKSYLRRLGDRWREVALQTHNWPVLHLCNRTRV